MNLYSFKKNNNQKNDNDEEGEKERIDYRNSYLNIWDRIPSYKDINVSFGLIRIIALFGIEMFMLLLLYFLIDHLLLALISTSLVMLSFLVIFKDNFFLADSISSKGLRRIDFFHNFAIWKTIDDEFSLYISNKKDLRHTGIRIFKITVIPENVRPNINHFVKSLYNARVPFTYQLVQNPFFHGKSETTKIEIYFTLSYYATGFLTKRKTQLIREALEEFSHTFKSICIANFPHFKFNLLFGKDLLKAIQTLILGVDMEITSGKSAPLKRSTEVFMKAFIVLVVIFQIDILLALLQWHIGWILLSNVVFLIIVFALFWREALYYLSQGIALGGVKEEIPYFHNLRFYRTRTLKDYLFLYLNDKFLLGSLIFNVKYLIPPQYSSDDYFIAKPEKFFRSIVNRQIPFTYTLINSPLSQFQFEKQGFDYLERFCRKMYLKNETEEEREHWAQMRGGLWHTSQIMSVHELCHASSISMKNFEDLALKLNSKIKEFYNLFRSNFPNYHLERLSSRKSIPGMIATMLKTKFFRHSGTHLDYSLVQGKTLTNLSEIAPEFKKGIETRIAAEFNSPLMIDNFITIGNTMNTEIVDKEVPAGFTLEQSKNLLLTNGSFQDRESSLMIIAAELVKRGIPSVIFDYSGNFSKLLTYFEGTQYEDSFLHFTLGRSFRINLLKSDMIFDKRKEKYRNLIGDIWAMAFKLKKKATETFRTYIKDYSLEDDDKEIDLSAMALDIQTQKNWEKSPYADSIVSLFKDFSEEIIYTSEESTLEGDKIYANHFIQDQDTIIVDLSLLKDLEQKVFIAFIMLAKIIHYVKKFDTFQEKIFFIPNIDILFDNWYLEHSDHLGYGQINKILEPLIQNKFGFVASTNEIRFLHPNTMNYFKNIVSFRATDSRDISALKNYLNLQELHGVGYYSNKRNDSYQIDFLLNLKKGEALVRRDDYNQPFPILINNEWNTINQMDYHLIVEYMLRKGYDLQKNENRILSDADTTLFERHFQNYIIFLNEIIKFLETMGKLGKVGNLYKTKLREELLKMIYPKAKDKFKNSTVKIREVRDNIFNILLKYNYIVEDHPRRASGSQSIRTSYSVGPQLKESLKDYYTTKDEVPIEASMEVVEQESDEDYILEEIFSENDGIGINDNDNNKKYRKEEFESVFMNLIVCDYFYDLSQINLALKKSNFKDALILEKDCLMNVLGKFFFHFHPEEKNQITSTQAIEFLLNVVDFPTDKTELNYLLQLWKMGEDIGKEEIKRKITHNFELLLQFFHKMYDEIKRRKKKCDK